MKYLKLCLNLFDQDAGLGLAAYNAGPGNVKKYNGCPPFPETQKFVAGGMPGVATLLGLYPAEDLAVVVLANTTSNATVGRIASEIVASLVPRYADTVRVRRARATQPRPSAWSTPAQLAGMWSGTVRTWQGAEPFTLVFQPDGDVVARLGSQPRALLWDAAWQGDSVFTGRLAGTMPTDDARLHRHTVWLKLTLRGGTPSGMATAQTVPPDTVFFSEDGLRRGEAVGGTRSGGKKNGGRNGGGMTNSGTDRIWETDHVPY